MPTTNTRVVTTINNAATSPNQQDSLDKYLDDISRSKGGRLAVLRTLKIAYDMGYDKHGDPLGGDTQVAANDWEETVNACSVDSGPTCNFTEGTTPLSF